MNCPKCNNKSCVIDNRARDDMEGIRRRRVCRNKACGHRFTTIELLAEDTDPGVMAFYTLVDDFVDTLDAMRATFKQPFRPTNGETKNGIPDWKAREIKRNTK